MARSTIRYRSSIRFVDFVRASLCQLQLAAHTPSVRRLSDLTVKDRMTHLPTGGSPANSNTQSGCQNVGVPQRDAHEIALADARPAPAARLVMRPGCGKCLGERA